jgi:hypothetical protein
MRHEVPRIFVLCDIVSQPMVVYKAVHETHATAAYC